MSAQQLVLIDIGPFEQCTCAVFDADGDLLPDGSGCCQYLEGLYVEHADELHRAQMAELAIAASMAADAAAEREWRDRPDRFRVQALENLSDRAAQAGLRHMATNAWEAARRRLAER